MTETSRSAYAVIASVRGIGVAVMISWCGKRAVARALVAQAQPLVHAEAVLLVDDDSASRAKSIAFLEQRVRADDDARFAAARRLRARCGACVPAASP